MEQINITFSTGQKCATKKLSDCLLADCFLFFQRRYIQYFLHHSRNKYDECNKPYKMNIIITIKYITSSNIARVMGTQIKFLILHPGNTVISKTKFQKLNFIKHFLKIFCHPCSQAFKNLSADLKAGGYVDSKL